MQIRDNADADDRALNSSDPSLLFEMHADMCQALGNKHRLAIMHRLKGGEKCVSELAAELDLSVHNVSQHLRILRERLLVRSRKAGQTVYYSVTNPKLEQACNLIREALVEEHRAAGRSLQAAADVDFLEDIEGEEEGTR